LTNGKKGHVLVAVGRKMQERDWNNRVVWEYNAAKLTPHHDWQKIPNGNYLILGRINVPKDRVPKEFYGLGWEGKSPLKLSGPWYGDRITEVTPDGKIVWNWYAHDHLDTAKVHLFPAAPAWGIRDTVYRGDWTHFNSIHYCTNPGYVDKILASNRHHNEAIMIDKKTGEVVWRWGEDILGKQHDVQMIEPGLPGEGNVLIFDNGYHSKAGTALSQVLEVDPETDEIVWSFHGISVAEGSFRSWHISGCQRLPNGNTFITEGESGRMFEVTTEGEIVWEFNNPWMGIHGRGLLNRAVFKARKVPVYWVPENIQLTPEMATAASLMGQARSQYQAADILVEQAGQILKYSKGGMESVMDRQPMVRSTRGKGGRPPGGKDGGPPGGKGGGPKGGKGGKGGPPWGGKK